MKNKTQICWVLSLQTFTPRFFSIFLTFLLISQQVLGQFQENFSDPDLKNLPTWMGTDPLFVVVDDQLKLQAPEESGIAYLSTASRVIKNASWEFKVTMEFNPSSSNYARIYITADQENISEPLNGYFVMVGDSKDEVSLYKQTGTVYSKIIDGRDGILDLSNVTVKIKVIRDETGGWQLFSDVGGTGNFVEEGTINDTSFDSTDFFGIFCKYTATRSTKFYFDDFDVRGDIEDDIPPELENGHANHKDIIITEIFADPSPLVGLPQAEFIEIFNRSEKLFNLKDWKLADESSISTLSGLMLLPGEYLILTSQNSNFVDFGKVLTLSNFPSLNNTADVVTLLDSKGITIDSVNYTNEWYKDEDKINGGWSLELIDPNNLCSEGENWIASENDKGGTPGNQNSVLANKPDLTGPKLLSAIPLNGKEIQIQFDEKLEKQLPKSIDFTITPATAISNLSFVNSALTGFNLSLNQELQKGLPYTIRVNGIYDCAGNNVHEEFSVVNFGLPEPADSLDVLINEILFDPKPTGVDFVEVVNNSSKFLNLKNWALATIEDGVVKNVTPITTNDFLFSPGRYLVLTENEDIVKGEYLLSDEKNFFEVGRLPGLNDDYGSLVLLDNGGKIVDYLVYTKDMHSVFIKDEEGVSLERISLELQTSSQNWKSASAAVGFATPGYLNSNSVLEVVTPSEILVQPEIFNPMGGQSDFTRIHYNFDQGGYVGNLKIFDSQGHLVKQLANNEILGTTGFYRWDGDHDDGSKARVGYYMIWFEIFNDTGEIRRYLKRVAIATTF